MTQPDELFPNDAANADSFAAFASKTQEEWESEQRGAEVDRWSPLSILAQLPIIGDFLEIITGEEDGDLNDLGSIGLSIRNLVLGIFTRVPAGAITNEQPNLLTAGTFPTGSIAENPLFEVDTDSRTNDSSGSAKVIADGTEKALRSGQSINDFIPVGSGQVITNTIRLRHHNYTGSGVAVRLQMVPYTDGVPGDPVTVSATNTLPGPGEVTVETPAEYTPETATVGWPGETLTGSYTIPDGVNGVQARILLTADAAGGTFWFDDAETKYGATLRRELVDGLPEGLADLLSRIQAVIDTIFNALTGGESLFNTLEDLLEAFFHIPSDNVDGVGGPATIGGSILAFINAIVGGLVGTPGEGASNADAFNIAKLISARASQGANAWEVLGYRNNTSVDNGMLPSSEANYNITVINATLEATQSASLIGIIRVQRSAPLGVVSWLGHGTSGLTAFYVNIWKVNATTGNWSLVHHSPNIVGDLVAGAVANWNFYFLDEPIARVQGEDYAYELVPVGGTHNVRGFSTDDDIPDHPYAQVVNLAATRDNTTDPDDPPSTIAKASVTRSNDVPWIETAIDSGNESDIRDPVTVYLTESTTVPIPRWAGYIDAIVLGAGGGGRKGLPTFFGEAGEPGSFNAATWERAVDFDDSVTHVTFVRGTGGSAGSTAGGAGTESTLSITDHSVVGAGGAGGTSLRFANPDTGQGPGEFTYKEETYIGGEDQNATGGAGVSPGGAGNGGNALGIQGGGAGGHGAAWIRFRQGVVEGSLDTTPPTAPTLTLVEATASAITVIASGATD